jgi:hypothetical protein
MTADLSFEQISHLLMLDERAPTPEALSRWQAMYPEYRDSLAEFFEIWAEQVDEPAETDAAIDEALLQRGADYAMEILRRYGSIVSETPFVESIEPFDQLVLAAIFLLRGDAYLVNITQKFKEISGTDVLLVSIVGSLGRLEKWHLIEWRYASPEAEPENDGRKYFMVTIAGERALAHAKAFSKEVADILGDFA